MKQRLDIELVRRKLAPTRSQAESEVKLGHVLVNGTVTTKPGTMTEETDRIELTKKERYVSRAAYKLESVAKRFKLDFRNKVVLDVGSSTGGFTDFALQNGAKRVIAVDVGTDQMHPSLRTNERVELHEKTDIRDVSQLPNTPDIVLIDLSFISLSMVLPHIATLAGNQTQVVAMVKPQFESGPESKHKGVVKNDRMRREILKQFETWAGQNFILKNKADSTVSGAKGNQERFYLLGLKK